MISKEAGLVSKNTPSASGATKEYFFGARSKETYTVSSIQRRLQDNVGLSLP